MSNIVDQLKPGDWITLAYTLVTMAAVAVAVITIRHNRKMIAANWLFSAHRGFHADDKLYNIFNQIKYRNYQFICEVKNGDLGTEKEQELVNFLDFINSVNAALGRRVISAKDLDRTTIGFAIEQARKAPDIIKYIQRTDEEDKKRDEALQAWGFLPRNGRSWKARRGRSRF